MGVVFRRDKWYIRFWLDKSEILMATNAAGKREARAIEHAVKMAVRKGEYAHLDDKARAICVRLFTNKGWELPASLLSTPEGQIPQRVKKDQLTLWRATQICLQYPEILNSPNVDRHKQSFLHVTEYFGKEFPVKDIWIPQIKGYQIFRQNKGASSSTINKERSALSKMFQVLIEMDLTDRNPVRMVSGLSERDSEREVYISLKDFNKLVENLPDWVKPIIQTLYFTGMRRGETLGLTWNKVNLDSRIIKLDAQDVKERRRKRVPIHRLLVPILRGVGRVRSLTTHQVFLTPAGNPPHPDAINKPWKEATEKLKINPKPTIHDLRHVWSTNAMRSGMDPEIREAIMGHATKQKSISRRYVAIGDVDYLREIDKMSFDHGDSEIWISRGSK